jgi:hypothetical protein
VRKIERDEIQNLYEYEKVREETRRRIIASKRARRVSVGDRLSFVFENRETVRFQIQEMIRAERIVADDLVQDEIDVYNALIPDAGELSATMMIEIEERARIKPELDRFMGIDAGERVWLQIGHDWAIPGRFEEGHSKEDKIAAVHYVRFALPAGARRALAAEPAALVVEHADYRARTALSAETRRALLDDLGVPAAAPGETPDEPGSRNASGRTPGGDAER